MQRWTGYATFGRGDIPISMRILVTSANYVTHRVDKASQLSQPLHEVVLISVSAN